MSLFQDSSWLPEGRIDPTKGPMGRVGNELSVADHSRRICVGLRSNVGLITPKKKMYNEYNCNSPSSSDAEYDRRLRNRSVNFEKFSIKIV